MKPYPFTSTRFDIDRYLDEQLAAQQESQRQEGSLRPFDNARYPFVITDGQPSTSRFRSWAIRLDVWCGRQLDRMDWPRIEYALGTIGGFFLIGVVCWFLWVCADAWLQGHFNIGAGR